MIERHLTVAAAAEILGVHQETVRGWIRDGKVPATRLGDRGRWLIPEGRARATLLRNEDRQRRRRVSWSSAERWGLA